MRNALKTAVCITAILAAASGPTPVLAQTELSAAVVAAGAAEVSGGGMTLRSTVGQTNVGPVTGTSAVHAGFWSMIFQTSQEPTARPDLPTDDLPTEFRLQPAYPNPFNPSTRISYELPQPVHVRLIVYNAIGQQIEVLVDERQSPEVFTKCEPSRC